MGVIGGVIKEAVWSYYPCCRRVIGGGHRGVIADADEKASNLFSLDYVKSIGGDHRGSSQGDRSLLSQGHRRVIGLTCKNCVFFLFLFSFVVLLRWCPRRKHVFKLNKWVGKLIGPSAAQWRTQTALERRLEMGRVAQCEACTARPITRS